jgi:hypothetical protein
LLEANQDDLRLYEAAQKKLRSQFKRLNTISL